MKNTTQILDLLYEEVSKVHIIDEHGAETLRVMNDGGFFKNITHFIQHIFNSGFQAGLSKAIVVIQSPETSKKRKQM